MAVCFTPFSPKTTLIVGVTGAQSVDPRSWVVVLCLQVISITTKQKAQHTALDLQPPMAFHHRGKIKVLPMVVFKALHEIVSACLSLCSVCVGFFFCPFARLFAAGSEPLDLTAFFQILLFLLSTGSFFFFFFFLCQT